MKKFCIVTFTLLISALALAQSNYKYGRMDVDYLKLESYEEDPEVPALIIFERGEAEIREDNDDRLKIFYTYKARIKIFDKSAFKYATFVIPLHSNDSGNSFEKLIEAKAISFNVGESSEGMSIKDVYYEDYSKNTRLAKFTIPKVKEGTVFDVEYTTTSPFLFYFPGWKFQNDVPTLQSEYFTKIPANYRYNGKLVGTIPFDSHVSDIERRCLTFGTGEADCGIDTYVMKNIPAFKKEEYMTSEENYISQIQYELRETQNFNGAIQKYSKTWSDVDHEFKTMDIGKQARKEKSFEKLIPENIAAMPKDIEKAKAIYYYLQDRMIWNGKNEIFSDVAVKNAFDDTRGNIAELNLVLLNMLKAADFEAYMVLVRERNDGFPTLLYPVITDFNYLITKLVLDGKVYYLDISQSKLPFGLLPLKALNNYGRVFDFKNDSNWDNIFMNSLSTKNIFMQVQLDAEGYITIKEAEKTNGFFAVNKRRKIASLSEDDYLKDLENDLSNSNNAFIKTYKNFNVDDPEKLLMENFEIEYEDALTSDQLLLNPLKNLLFSKNPFKLKERNYPVDFGYPQKYDVKVLIKLDGAYEIVRLPESFSYEYNNVLKLNFKTLTQGTNNISLMLDFSIYKSVYLPEEYEELKKIFNDLIDICNSDIILKRKK